MYILCSLLHTVGPHTTLNPKPLRHLFKQKMHFDYHFTIRLPHCSLTTTCLKSLNLRTVDSLGNACMSTSLPNCQHQHDNPIVV